MLPVGEIRSGIRFVWTSSRDTAGGRELLILIGGNTPIVIAKIKPGSRYRWMLILDIHRDVGRQRVYEFETIAAAMRAAEHWIEHHRRRLERG